MNSKRAILRIQLDTSSKQRLDTFCGDRGMTQIAVMSRLVDWFVHQNEVIQLSVLGLLSKELSVPLARQILQQSDLQQDGQQPNQL